MKARLPVLGRTVLLFFTLVCFLTGLSGCHEKLKIFGDYFLQITPSKQTVKQTQTATFTITVIPVDGFFGGVSLTCPGSPPQLSLFGCSNLGSVTLPGPGTATLTIPTSCQTKPGTYTIPVQGVSDDGIVHSNDATLVVVDGCTQDFTLTAMPPSQNVVAGDNAEYTASISPINGFSGTTDFTATAPAGISASFAPPSIVGGSGNTTLTLGTTPTTTPGSYNVVITATGNGVIVHMATVTVVVEAPPTPDFKISASPTPQSVMAGGGTTYDVTVTAVGSFNGVVNLSVTAPAGVPGLLATLNTTQITGGGGSTLTVTTTSATPAGSYMLTVTGMSGTLTHSTTVTLNVTAGSLISGLNISAILAPPTVAGSTNANAIILIQNTGTTGIDNVSTAITGLGSGVLPVALNIESPPGSCTLATLTCTLSGTLAPGTGHVVILTYQAPPGTVSFTATATLSAPGAQSATATFSTAFMNCAPAPQALCGQYVLFVQGYGPDYVALNFMADGMGNITNGLLFTVGVDGAPIASNSGSGYSFDADGLGNLAINAMASAGFNYVFKFALDPNSGTSGSVIEYDPSGAMFAPQDGMQSGSGFLQVQSPDFFVTQVNGTYSLALIGASSGTLGTRLGMLGAVTTDGKCNVASTGATGTINNGGALSRSISVSGTLGPGCFVGASNGEGTGMFSSITGTPAPSFSTIRFNYFILDTNPDATANHILLFTNQQPLLSGILTSQNNAPFNTNAALDCGLVSTNQGCVFAFGGATGGNSLTGNSYLLAGLASLTTQSNTAGAFNLLRDENNGGTVTSGSITASYSYNADGTGSFTPPTGEVIDFVLTDIDTGAVLSEGSNVSFGSFAPQLTPFVPFNPAGPASATFAGGTQFLGVSSAPTTVGLATINQMAAGSNTGTFSGNTAFWNTATHQNTAALSGTYSLDPSTTRVSGTTNITGAASFAAYPFGAGQFVLIGITSADTAAVLLVF